MPDKQESESRLSFPPDASTSLLDPTNSSAARCHSRSLPSLLLPSSTPHPNMQPSCSLFLPQQAQKNPLMESSQQPTIPALSSHAGQKRKEFVCDLIYLTKYILLLVVLGIGGGFLVWIAMRLTSTQIGNTSTPLYFSSVDPEDRELCGIPGGGRVRNRRVVGGDQSDYAEWPWTVSQVRITLHLYHPLILLCF